MNHSSTSLLRPGVLLIDDSLVDLRLLMNMMTAHSLRVTVSMNGADGARKAAVSPPDLILLDVYMPGMDGFATCRMLKADPRTAHIPVIFLSAATEAAQRVEGLRLGAVDYIGKPFNEVEVMTRTRIHLNIAAELARLRGLEAKAEATPPPDAAEHRRDKTLVNAAVAYLRQNMAEPPSPEKLAGLLGTNEKRLTRAFHEHFAMPVHAWLREERLKGARELLMTSDTPISTIAACLGYANQGNFTRSFKERFGCSPRALRKEPSGLESAC